MRHTSKKWLEIAAIALSASLVMSGCGGNAANNSTNEAKATNQGQGGHQQLKLRLKLFGRTTLIRQKKTVTMCKPSSRRNLM